MGAGARMFRDSALRCLLAGTWKKEVMDASHAERVFSGEETAETVISTGSKYRVNSQRLVWMVISTLWLGWDFKTWVNVNEWNRHYSLWLWCSCVQLWAGYVILLLFTLSEEKTAVVQRFPSIEAEWECLFRKGDLCLTVMGEHCLCGLYNSVVQGGSLQYQWGMCPIS